MRIKPFMAGAGLVLLVVVVVLGLAVWRAVDSLSPEPPDRILEPEIVGIVTDQQQGSLPVSRIYVVNGVEVEIHPTNDIDLGGPGPGEDRLLVVARDGEDTYYLSLLRDESMGTDCHNIHARGFDATDGVVFSFSPNRGGHLGLLLPKGPEYEPTRVDEQAGLIMSESTFCITSDGMVHAPDIDASASS